MNTQKNMVTKQMESKMRDYGEEFQDKVSRFNYVKVLNGDNGISGPFPFISKIDDKRREYGGVSLYSGKSEGINGANVGWVVDDDAYKQKTFIFVTDEYAKKHIGEADYGNL